MHSSKQNQSSQLTSLGGDSGRGSGASGLLVGLEKTVSKLLSHLPKLNPRFEPESNYTKSNEKYGQNCSSEYKLEYKNLTTHFNY